MSQEIKNRIQLINLLAKHPIKPKRFFGLNCNHAQFSEWSRVDPSIFNKMSKIGEMNIQVKKAMNTNYWGSGSPIEVDKYPYCNCEIYICSKCNNLFFYYTEHGGHSAEKRMRIMKESAIVNNENEYYMNLAIPRSIEQFHNILKQDLNFPEFYGANWDAFWDTITGIVELPKTVVFYNYNVFVTNWKDKAKILKELVNDYNSQTNGNIQLVNGMVNLN